VLCFIKRGQTTAWGLECAHYIGRGQSGLGIEQNLVMLCPTCHREYDQSTEREADREILAAYLKRHYPDWTEEDLTYNKWRRT
jgi:hypothetical protein